MSSIRLPIECSLSTTPKRCPQDCKSRNCLSLMIWRGSDFWISLLKTDDLGFCNSGIVRYHGPKFIASSDDGNLNRAKSIADMANSRKDELLALAIPAMMELALRG